ncbi:MAG: hypothetical protein JWO42_2536, partial [Chloroflexi bacterium]|nr:hypothetical protein [Chloroflexota bacterium]
MSTAIAEVMPNRGWLHKFLLVYVACFEIFLVWHPVSHDMLAIVDTIATFVGIILAFGLCVGRPPWFWLPPYRHGSAAGGLRPAAKWAPVLFGLGVLCYALVSLLEVFFGSSQQTAPFSSWVDAGYLTVYPPLLVAILLLPRRPITFAVRSRIALDSLMIITALITFSWYFVIGPTIARGDATLYTKVLGSALPIGDLVLSFCMLGLWMQKRDRELDRVIMLFAIGLVGMVVGDSILDYQLLHGTYYVGSVIDPIWPLGYLIAGLGAQKLRKLLAKDDTSTKLASLDHATRVRPWRALAPYAFLPMVAAMVWYVTSTNGDQSLKNGVYLCAAFLCALVLGRQLAALLENARLNGQLTKHTHELEQRNVELQTMLTTNSALTTANAQLEVLANTDMLTGLASRGVLYDRLGQALLMHERDRTPLSLLLMDLDRFKEVNDSLGHLVGDRLLQLVGERLQAALRRVDTVARLGGDEFAILLPATDEPGAVKVARTVLAIFEAPFEVDGFMLTVGASIGIALASASALDSNTLVRHADVAMYLAKRTQRGHVVYDAALDDQSPERLVLISALRQALATDQLLVYFQPKLSLKTGKVCGAEALARWPHPEQGFVPPDRFIPLAEHVGLIGPLTVWILRSALRHSKQWSKRGIDVPVSVNLSASSLDDPQLCATIAGILEDEGISPSQLILEITENTLMTDPTRALGVISELKALGIQLAIDDFGTGYSSLSYLKYLPVDELKIDRSFVQGLGVEGTTDRAIVRAIIDVGHALHRRVVAEGVEDQLTWELLRTMGCDSAQGFHMSRPLPADEILEWML